MDRAPKSRSMPDSPKRILVVDDEPEVSQFVVRILEEHGFDACAVNDQLLVCEQAAEIRPDLIILDFDMPKLLGTELAMLLKKGPETCNIPLIFLSAMTDPDHHAIGLFSGAAAYLDKPLDVAKLIGTIHSILGGR